METERKPIVCSYYLDVAGNRYETFSYRLIGDCKKFGIDYDIGTPRGILEFWNDKPGYADKRHWLPRYKPTYIIEALNKHKRPIYYLDCDSKIINEPNWEEFKNNDMCYDIGRKAQNDNDIYGGIPAAVYYNYSPIVFNFLSVWKYKCDNIISNAADHIYFSNTIKEFTHRNEFFHIKRIPMLDRELNDNTKILFNGNR